MDLVQQVVFGGNMLQKIKDIYNNLKYYGFSLSKKSRQKKLRNNFANYLTRVLETQKGKVENVTLVEQNYSNEELNRNTTKVYR